MDISSVRSGSYLLVARTAEGNLVQQLVIQ
jgi:hypothetical protein